MRINTGCWVDGCKCFDPDDEDGVEIKQDKEWVGLTDDEIDDIWDKFNDGRGYIIDETLWGYERALEAKLREKNG